MSSPPRETASYAPTLGLFSTTMLVVGGVIGSGIFLNPAIVAQRVPGPAWVLLVWTLGGLVSLAGAFIWSELGAQRPRAGGAYVFLRDAWGPLPAFMYGWALFLIIATGAIAAVAVTSANYLVSLAASVASWTPSEVALVQGTWGRPIATLLIVALTLLNAIGVAPGAALQSLFTVLKLAAIAMLVIVGVIGASAVDVSGAAGAAVAAVPTPGDAAAPPSLLLALAAALVPVLFAYGGWQQSAFVAEEVRDAPRTLPRALVLGVSIVVTAYLLANIAYLDGLGLAGLAASTAPAADTMAAVLGDRGRTMIAVGIVISTIGFLDLVILATPRVYQAMAADGLFFRGLARLHPTRRTPIRALVAQGGLAIALAWLGTYGELLDYVVFADWIFFGLTAAAALVFRRREGIPERARMPLWPLPLVLFLGATLYVLVGTITSNPGNAARGVLLFALGLPAFAWWRRRATPPS